MGLDKLVFLLPLAVAVIGGMFVLISSTTAKEKEIKLNKYEELGFETYALMEACANYLSRLYFNVYEKIRHGSPISIKEIREIVDQISTHYPDTVKGRELSVKLIYADKKSSYIFNNYLNEFSSLYNELINITHVTKLQEYKIKSSHTHDEAMDIIRRFGSFIEKTSECKLEITHKLSNKYNSTLNYSNKLSLLCIFIITSIFGMAYYQSTPSKKPPMIATKPTTNLHPPSDNPEK